MTDEHLRWILAAVLSVLGGTAISTGEGKSGKEWTMEYVIGHTVSKDELNWKLESIDNKITQCNVNVEKLRKEVMELRK